MGIFDYLSITFVALIPIILLLFSIQEKLERINYRKYWDGTVNKLIMLLGSIWAIMGLIMAVLGLLELFKGSDYYGLIILIILFIIIYFGTEIISSGIAKMIDKCNKKED